MRDIKMQAGGETYTLRFSTNAIVGFEEAAGESITTAMQADNLRFGTLRQLVHSGLSDHHPNLSLRDAGDVMDAAGMTVLMDRLQAAIVAAFPDAEGDAGNAATGSTPTGTTSRGVGSASATATMNSGDGPPPKST